MPWLLHSAMYLTTLSDECISLVSREAMNSNGIMGFQIGGLIGDERIRCTVGLVEAVAAELFHQVEYAFRFILGDAVVRCALYKNDRNVLPASPVFFYPWLSEGRRLPPLNNSQARLRSS